MDNFKTSSDSALGYSRSQQNRKCIFRCLNENLLYAVHKIDRGNECKRTKHPDDHNKIRGQDDKSESMRRRKQGEKRIRSRQISRV